jgi:hypothetical protein
LRGLNPGSGKIFISFSKTSKPDVGPTHPPIQWVVRAISTGVKWFEYEIHHSLPSSAKAKKKKISSWWIGTTLSLFYGPMSD